MVSQQAHLYAHQLSQCPSYSAAHHSIPVPEDDDSLPKLRRLFAREIKRNLFEAYLRPKETIINLVSTSISSSSAPGGEAFHFSLSPCGHYVLAYSSSRIHVLDVTSSEIRIERELKILRRPASTTITDDGKLLAVLSTDMQVDLYDLRGEHPKHTRSVALDHTPRTIALSPTGSVLAAAYDSGVEVSSLDPGCTSSERRAVKCYAVDSLAFSKDGTQLLGTTAQSRNPSTVVLTAPYYDPGGNLPEESTSALWTTSILFPNGSRDCSHAVLLPSDSDDGGGWTFTYDRVFETFRAVRIDDLRNGTTYFTGPTADSHSNLLPSTLPAASEVGDLVVSGFQGHIWIYGVPEDLEALPKTNGTNNIQLDSDFGTPSTQLGRRNSAPSLRSITRPRENNSRTPQWQLLCDRFRNTFIEGRNVTTLDRVSAMTWVHGFSTSSHKERLVAVAPGVGGLPPESEDDSMHPTDGGRITILDFDYGVTDGTKRIITIEVGNNEPEVLEEEHRDIDTEVAIVRRRTVAQRRGRGNSVARSATTVTRANRPPVPQIPQMPDLSDTSGPFRAPAPGTGPNVPQVPPTDQAETASIDEDDEAFDAPYSQTDPRSTTTLRRAATAAAVNRRLHPRAVAQDHIEYRRADGREEHPHESDADNWVPPPPPYSRDPVPTLPEHIQRSILAEAAAANLQRANTQRNSSIDFPGLDGNSLQRSRTFASVSSASSDSRRDRFPFPRTRSESITRTLGPVAADRTPPLPRIPSPVSPNFDDLYDVSPPSSPQPSPRRYSEPIIAQQDQPSPESSPEQEIAVPAPLPVAAHQITRKPVGATLPKSSDSSPASPPTPAPIMTATIRQPVSPIPQPQPTPEILNRRLMDWENTSSTEQSSPGRPSSPSSGLTRERMEQDVPPRPNENHHLSSPPPSAPQRPRDVIESQSAQARPSGLNERHTENITTQPTVLSKRRETFPSKLATHASEEELLPWGRRAETAPVPSQVSRAAANTSVSHDFVGPSAEQIARLNSRKNRPPSQIMADPRRTSVNYSQPGNFSQSGPMAISGLRSVSDPLSRPGSGGASSYSTMQHTPSCATSNLTFRATPPKNAVGAYGSSPSSSNARYSSQSGYSQKQNSYPPPTRRTSLSTTNNSLASIPSPNSLRPSVNRLDTIHSATSVEPPSSWQHSKPVAVGVSRNSSRAERSAAKNIKDAKKRGWRASMRPDNKKDKWGDASSTGWTDASDMRSEMGRKSEREKKSGKCAIM